MKRSLSLLLFLASSLILTTPADARLHKGGVAVPVSAPILQAADINIGNLTRTGKSGSRLSSIDRTTAAIHPVTFKGVDLIVGGAPVSSWTITYVSGRSASDFTLIAANAPESTSALTPVVASGGQGNITGDYVFNVTAKDAGGHSSNTVTLTVHVVNPTGGGCINIGQDNSAGTLPAGFGTNPNQCVLWSTGVDHELALNRLNLGTGFTQDVVFTYADITKPAAFTNFQLSTTSHAIIQDLLFSGDLVTAIANGAVCVVCSDTSGAAYGFVKTKRVFGYFQPFNGPSGAFYNAKSCSLGGCGIEDSGVEYMGTGINTNGSMPSVYVKNTWVRYFYNNCYALQGPVAVDNDSMCIAPNVRDSQHTDVIQIQDGATPDALNVHHFWSLEAGGDDQAQGPYFGGAIFNSLCYISNAAGSSSPGNVITCTTNGFQTQSNKSHIYSPTGSPVGVADNVILTCPGGNNCGGGKAGTVNITASVGSPASPVLFYSANGYHYNFTGIISTNATPHGMDSPGELDTWILDHFAYIRHYAQPFYAPSFTGQIAGNILTISTLPVGNIAGEPVFVGTEQRLGYSGCNYCGVGIDHQISGTASGIGTYLLTSSPGDIGPIAMTASSAYPQGAAGGYQLACASTDEHTGTATISNGYFEGGYITSGSCPPANTVQTHMFSANLTGADFLSGVLPSAAFESHPNSFYQAMTPAQLRTFHCNTILPKVGGQLDGGGGVWYWPVTNTGEWTDDGTVIPGCGIH